MTETDLQPWTAQYGREHPLEIVSDEHSTQIAERLVQIKAYQKAVVAWFRGSPHQPGPLSKAYATYTDLLEKEKAALKPANDEEPWLKKGLDAWSLKQEAAAAAENARLQRIADEDARLRRQAEIDARAADAALHHDVDALYGAAIEEQQPVQAQAVVLERRRSPALGGGGSPITYVPGKWKVDPDTPVDILALARAVVANPERYPPSYLLANTDALDRVADATAGQTKVPGVVFKQGPRTVKSRSK